MAVSGSGPSLAVWSVSLPPPTLRALLSSPLPILPTTLTPHQLRQLLIHTAQPWSLPELAALQGTKPKPPCPTIEQLLSSCGLPGTLISSHIQACDLRQVP